MHTPFDKRVFEKEARTLAAAGFAVSHIAPGDGCSSIVSDVNIVTYYGRKGLIGRIFQLRKLYRLGALLDADVYHCNELDSWLVGLTLKLVKKRKCVVDIHEHYPEEFSEIRFPIFLRRFVRFLVAFAIKLCSKYTDIVVVAKSSLLRDFKHLHDKELVLVQNYSPLRNFGDQPSLGSVSQSGAKKFTMIHLGLFGVRRGWPQLLDAMQILNDPEIKLLVVGDIVDGSEEEFIEKSLSSGLAESIEMIGWLPIDEAMDLVSSADLGLILFQPDCHNHVHALPHKLFDYMGAGLPVIVPEIAVEVASIVSESDCGVCVDTGSPEAIAAAIAGAKADISTMKQKGENGREAVFSKYNWENEERRLIDIYNDFSNQITPASE